MNTAIDILAYARTHDINLNADDGQLKIDAPETALTDKFLELAKQHKSEILEALTRGDRWDPELAAKGYVWCLDCQHWGRTACTHTDNPFRNQQPLTPRKCRWYEAL